MHTLNWFTRDFLAYGNVCMIQGCHINHILIGPKCCVRKPFIFTFESRVDFKAPHIADNNKHPEINSSFTIASELTCAERSARPTGYLYVFTSCFLRMNYCRNLWINLFAIHSRFWNWMRIPNAYSAIDACLFEHRPRFWSHFTNGFALVLVNVFWNKMLISATLRECTKC